ncbi:MAG: tetratricopeptide repeat protein [Bacteroidia bacterium]|nr:tetratricopeptide repeat protein [Bacteroidia bacterium]
MKPAKKKYFFLLLFFPYMAYLFSQSNPMDSLKLALKNAKHDTTRCGILVELIDNLPEDKWGNYNEQLIEIAERNLLTTNKRQPEYKIYKNFYGSAYLNMGYSYQNHGNIPRALDCYEICLKTWEQIGETEGVANALNNMGYAYEQLGDFQKAMDYYQRTLLLQEKAGNKQGIALALHNIGGVYGDQNNMQKALEYYTQSLKITEEIGDRSGLASAYSTIGVVYHNQKNYAKALEYYNQSLKLRHELGEKRAEATTLSNIALLYVKQKNYTKALPYALKSMAIAKELGYPDAITRATRQLTNIYKATGNYNLALENYELFIQMRDSIANTETKKAAIKSQLKYEYEKKSAADSVKNAEQQKVKDAQLDAQNASLKQEKFQRYSLIVGLLIVLAGLGFVINRFRLTQKQKKIIEEQKIIVDEAFEKLHEKNKEVIDSIYYARRIQRALLTSEKYIERVWKKPA